MPACSDDDDVETQGPAAADSYGKNGGRGDVELAEPLGQGDEGWPKHVQQNPRSRSTFKIRISTVLFK